MIKSQIKENKIKQNKLSKQTDILDSIYQNMRFFFIVYCMIYYKSDKQIICVIYFRISCQYTDQKLMLEQQSNCDFVDIRSLKEAGCFSDCLGFQNPINPSNISLSSHCLFNKKQPVQEELYVSENEGEQYYKILFSPQQTAKSLIKRNQYLEMKHFENSGSEMEDIYQRRKQRLSKLNSKDAKQWEIFNDLKHKEKQKYIAFTSFMKVFATIKSSISHIRNDYYSNKTFNALKNTSEHQLRNATKIVNKMFQEVMSLPIFSQEMLHQEVDQRFIEFLTIPRFLISKQKVIKFTKDEQLQENFKFLVYCGCLGHYNNQANKKLPDSSYMNYFRQLIIKKNGRQRYKRICSINHGSKFITYDKQQYFSLYGKSLQCLKHIDQQVKKKTLKLNDIGKEAAKFSEDNQKQRENQMKILSLNVKKQQREAGTFNQFCYPRQLRDQISVSNFLNSNYRFDDIALTKSQSKKTTNLSNDSPSLCKIKKAKSLPVNAEGKLKMKRALTFQIVPPPMEIEGIAQVQRQLEQDPE